MAREVASLANAELDLHRIEFTREWNHPGACGESRLPPARTQGREDADGLCARSAAAGTESRCRTHARAIRWRGILPAARVLPRESRLPSRSIRTRDLLRSCRRTLL